MDAVTMVARKQPFPLTLGLFLYMGMQTIIYLLRYLLMLLKWRMRRWGITSLLLFEQTGRLAV
jgi:hypothetical protein